MEKDGERWNVLSRLTLIDVQFWPGFSNLQENIDIFNLLKVPNHPLEQAFFLRQICKPWWRHLNRYGSGGVHTSLTQCSFDLFVHFQIYLDFDGWEPLSFLTRSNFGYCMRIKNIAPMCTYHDQDHIMIKMFNFAVKRWIIKIFYNKIQNPKVRGLNRFALMSSAGANYPQCIMGLFGSSRLAACSSKFTDLLPCDVRRISDNFRKWI